MPASTENSFPVSWGIPVVDHEIRAGQDRAHDFALYSDSAAVDDADSFEAQVAGLLQ